MGDAGGQQVYEAWDLGFSEPLDLTVEALIDDWEGFRILLRNHKTGRMMRIAFDTHAAYQNRDETDVVGELSRSGITKPGHFYRVANSEFVARFLKNTARSYLAEKLTHFVILTEMDCIDVLAATEPRVEDLKDAARELVDRSIERQKPQRGQ